jgi:multiple sugar transport system substrate-binding protein
MNRMLRWIFLTFLVMFVGMAAAQTRITYGYWSAAQRPMVEAEIAAFEAQNPDIDVEPQLVPWAQYWTQLQTSVAGGDAFDVFWMNGPNFQVYASQNVLAPLEPALADVDVERYPEALVDLYTYRGTVYGMPKDFDTLALAYNKALFDEAGVEYPTADWTWEDLRSAAERLTKGSGNRVTQFGFSAEPNLQRQYGNFIHQNGGRIINEEGTEVLVDEPAACEAITFLYEFHEDGIAPGGPELQALNWEPQDAFVSGRIAMYITLPAQVLPITQANPNIELAPLPQGRQRATLIHGVAHAVWSRSRNQNAAYQLLNFLASEEAQRIQAETSTVIPAIAGIQDQWLQSVPAVDLEVFLEGLAYTYPYPTSPSGAAWEANVTSVLQEAWLGNVPKSEMCERAAAEGNRALSNR